MDPIRSFIAARGGVHALRAAVAAGFAAGLIAAPATSLHAQPGQELREPTPLRVRAAGDSAVKTTSTSATTTTTTPATQTDTARAAAVTPAFQGPPEKLALIHNRGTSFVIRTDTAKASKLRVAYTTLQDAGTAALLSPGQLLLCYQGHCGPEVDLPARASSTVELRVDSTFRENGTFRGTVYLASAQAPAGVASFPLAVQSTTRGAQAAGALLILAGILVALLVTVWLRQRAVRAQAYLPAARLAQHAGDLRKELGRVARGIGVPANTADPAAARFPLATRTLDDLVAELGEDELAARGFIPARIAPAAPAADNATEYQQFLTDTASQLAGVRVVVVRGIVPVAARWTSPPEPKVDTALTELDAAAQQVTDTASAIALVAQIIARMEGRAANVVAEDMGPATAPTVRAVTLALQRSTSALWIGWALVTWVTGIAVLVAVNYGFGAGLDYFKCFFWGLGLQAAGTQLDQLTPASVATAFHVTMPRT